jgi:molybdenum cofactor guanylyltransferase
MQPSSITIAILAGGSATRLGGHDKGLQDLGGQPLIGQVIDAVAAMDIGDRDLLIVANRHLEEYSRYGTTISDDAPGFRGPLAGVASALAACATSWLLTIPVDCPEPPRELASRLLQAAQVGETVAVVAHDGECRQPLFAIYRCELAASAAVAVAAGKGVWQWQTSISVQELDFSDCRRQFRNLNTPEDFTRHAHRDDA